MNAKFDPFANLLMILYLILVEIPKYLISDLPQNSTCSLNRKVESDPSTEMNLLSWQAYHL